jgi:hypothetical protein
MWQTESRMCKTSSVYSMLAYLSLVRGCPVLAMPLAMLMQAEYLDVVDDIQSLTTAQPYGFWTLYASDASDAHRVQHLLEQVQCAGAACRHGQPHVWTASIHR